MDGKLVILSGPSGSGKDTVIEAWKGIDADVNRVVAYTTRSPRKGETDDVDYHFVSPGTFESMVKEEAFLEWKEVHGNLYGTPVFDMERMIREGKIAVLKIDVQGALTAMEKRPDAITIFLEPPSMDELEQRIRDRRTDTEHQIEIRMKNAVWEMAHADRYQHRVINADAQRAAEEIDHIVSGKEVA
ncbi:MAG: guanylate kinase [Armatimonadetes bacterium]|nr:guanylate kinase [Armatimonadota bacterium]